MRQQILRDGSTGRILGRIDSGQWFSHDDEYWQDHKVSELVFPTHKQNEPSPVRTYHISELKNK
jgi:hypothetical protein